MSEQSGTGRAVDLRKLLRRRVGIPSHSGDFTYLGENAKRVAIVTSTGAEGDDVSVYNGVLALIDDYDRALAAFPAE
jgi:hypothetical protein